MIKRRWTTSIKEETTAVSINPPPTERESSSTSTSFSDFIPEHILWPQGRPKYIKPKTDFATEIEPPDESITEYIEQLYRERIFAGVENDETAE